MSRSLSGFAMAAAIIALPFLIWAILERREAVIASEITENMPTYPGARLTDGSGPELAYELPRGTTRTAVDRFYARRMDGWKRPEGCPGFERQGDLVLVGVDVFDHRYLKILVKPGEAGDCDRWSWFIYS